MKLILEEIKNWRASVKAGDEVFVSGYVYTARDAVHKRLAALIEKGEPLPINIDGAVIYYAGPSQTPPGAVIGSCGPTTSSRMDAFAPMLLDLGLAAMIGKGERSDAVKDAIVKNKALYFCAVGGAGALASRCIKSVEVIAFEELGCESLKRLYIEDFPLYCANDIYGGDIFSH